MPLSISTEVLKEKNKLSSSEPWILLLEFTYPGEDPVRLAWNTEDVTWDGFTWYAAPFELGDQEESTDATVPTVDLRIIDISRKITPLLDQYDGAVGATVILRVVHNAHLDLLTPEYEADFKVVDTSINHLNAITFKLGAENLSNYRSPPEVFLKKHCRYKEFKGNLCGYSGTATDCDRTWERCQELGNQKRFGGFPGIGRLGVKG